MMVGYGFIGFLASWLVKHDPLKIIGSAVLLGAIAVGGNGLKLSAGLSGAAVYILMAADAPRHPRLEPGQEEGTA